ncbi:MAG TPA: arginine--tRNA ligase [Solirubrobacteraceae bacterium]|nr:arginine--tRNA ligase [Solirubrobacteraceae bacterium]
MSALADLRAAVAAAASLVAGREREPSAAPTLARAPRPEFGDYSTNAAMLLAPLLGESPRRVAERVGEELAVVLGDRLDRVEVAGPGFVNLFLSPRWYEEALATVLAAGEDYGGGGADSPERVCIEFVSANPTGPLHVGHGRQAAYGDAVARLLAFHGHEVSREYYLNDYGSQIARLADSIAALARDEPVPEDGYHGDYVAALVPLEQARGLDRDTLGRLAVNACAAQIRATLDRFRVHFDEWFSERFLHEGDRSPVAAALAALEAQGEIYRSDGALWLRTTAHGDDKDRVLVRSSGEHTYFASDVAYHQNKLARGFQRLIDVWGSDHHGYIARMRAAFVALGGAPEQLELIIIQFVELLEGGARASMSKRAGVGVTLDDLMAEIGVDAARWFLLSRSADTTVELDLDLARRESNENPVYYVQYAHARIHSVLRKAGAERVTRALEEIGTLADHELHPSERVLLARLLAFPPEVADAAERRAPHRVAGYALELAQDFTAFYRDCRIVGAESAQAESFRLAVAVASARVIARALDLLGLQAPEVM